MSTEAYSCLLKHIHVYWSTFISTEAYSCLLKHIHVYWSMFMSTEACSYLLKHVHVYWSMFMSTEACLCLLKHIHVYWSPTVSIYNFIHFTVHLVTRQIDRNKQRKPRHKYWRVAVTVSVEEVLLACKLPPYGEARDGLQHYTDPAFRKKRSSEWK